MSLAGGAALRTEIDWSGHRDSCQCVLVDKEEERELYVVDFSQAPGVAERREERDRDRQEARRRYQQLLAAELDAYGVANPAELADLVLETLLTWRRTGSGDECMCGCHPKLPNSDFHDFGFDCGCRKTSDELAQSHRDFAARMRAFRESPEGQKLNSRNRAERAAVREWVASQPGLVVHEFGGLHPEQWRGDVDGHSFYFRERSGEWSIELDLRPTGGFVHMAGGSDEEGKTVTESSGIEVGDLIATGAVEEPGYGTTLLEHGQFIVDIVRTHIARQACSLHSAEEVALVQELLGRPVLWCPACGIRLPTSR